jgi:hypothetical protein
MDTQNEITILPVPPAELVMNWPIIEPMIAAALPVTIGRFLPIDVLAMTIAGGAQGWFVREGNKIIATIITRLDVYPRRRCLCIWAIGGTDMERWFDDAEEVMTKYARQIGADHFELQGRKGWARYFDLEPRSVFLIRDLTEVQM